jgi:NTP pyrophosphatase (non-canonical NTP hydrolase)
MSIYTEVFNTIKHLSLIDEKSLTAKALKTAEEVGELAKVINPYEGGFATTHRFVTTERILEEAVDTALCSLSIAYSLGFTDEDIADMMTRKCVKWSKLQQANIKGRYPLPFEIHVTVKLDPEKNLTVDWFKRLCTELGVKPIVLDLKPGVQDVMTSSSMMSDNIGVYNELNRISVHLREKGFTVVREKVETVPWHPAAPTIPEDVNKDLYFESHINLVITGGELFKVATWNDQYHIGGHLSKNIFKRIDDNYFVQMLTLRSSTITKVDVTTAGAFIAYVDDVIDGLKKLLHREDAVLKHVVEYAIYDTKVSHDLSWVKN